MTAEFEMTITAKEVISTDKRFTLDNPQEGTNYEPIDAYFKKTNGDIIRRKKEKGEPFSGKTMPRLCFQVFEKQISEMTDDDKKNFPICKYGEKEPFCAIYSNEDEYKRKTKQERAVLTYQKNDGGKFVIYYWNLFTPIIFVQECLARFGEPGDQFILIYKDKEKDGAKITANDKAQKNEMFLNPYSDMLISAKNLIFRGAPGTGKSYLAKQIATDIISDGQFYDYNDLTDEQKEQMEFVQFHPSYDYTDFVEGLRPIVNEDGTMGFSLQDGIFKKFVARARRNYEDSQESENTEEKKYIFIIDEINRGEISKILGELFFSIDPGYRGKAGEISTQYSNMHSNPEEKFYIPDNVYIIGTMNDIDRSVDTFDFAMRRRFRFVEIKAKDRLEMLEALEDEALKEEAIRRMNSLNNEIANVEDLNENYHIGASYFLKLKALDFDKLWEDYLKPLLQEYIQGMYDEDGIMKKFEKAYYQNKPEGQINEDTQD